MMKLNRVLWTACAVLLACSFAACGDDGATDDGNGQVGATTGGETTTGATTTQTSTDTTGTTTGGGETTGGETNTTPFPDCTYPEGASRRPSYGQVMPELTWKGAYRGNGDQVEFSIRELYCSPEYDDIETITFFVGAGWCPNCPDLARAIYNDWAALRDEKTFLVWYEVENDEFELASNEEAQASITRYIGEGGPGVRVGDANTEPTAGLLSNNVMVQAFPSMFTVRRSDMKVIAASVNTQYIFPYLQIARYPDADWDNPWDNTLGTNAGAECRKGSDCDSGTLIPQCVPDRDPDTNERTGWNRGYCIAFGCETDAACGDGNVCVDTGDDLGVCYAGCSDDDDCRSGYECRGAGIGSEASGPVCVPQ